MTGRGCTFDTLSYCTFATEDNCTFKTEGNCTFRTGSGCTFKTGKNCVAIRYDVDGVIEILEGKTIKFNEDGVAGYILVEPKMITIELTQEQLDKIKEQGLI